MLYVYVCVCAAIEGLPEKRTFSSGSDPAAPSTDSGWDVGKLLHHYML